ncbi:MAG: sigma-54 dependent transcriptional regulator [Planctomycetota bacterium]|nr:sigma-54 dependent transcriptional regulator [Planctomycetota bacterium]
MMDGGEQSPQLVVRSPQEDVLADVAIIGASEALKQVQALADAVAHNDCVVLLEGESGTGKELIARRIHVQSPRALMPFVPVNCPGISQSLFESQFYGHVKGAFTGATTDTLGVVRAADGGTLLLDEIGELALDMQPKLLRLLQEEEVTPVGASRPIPVNTRFIAATNRDLRQGVREGTFRSDLFHRLNIVRIVLPPLRDRPEDVPALLDFYLAQYAVEYRMAPRQLSRRLYDMLQDYPWPGNVRELAAYVERLYATRQPPMPPGLDEWQAAAADSTSHPPAARPDRSATPGPTYAGPNFGGESLPARMASSQSPSLIVPPSACRTLAQAEAQAIRAALAACRYNRTAAAKILDIHRSTLIRKMRQLPPPPPDCSL